MDTPAISAADRRIVADLARRNAELAALPIQAERRELWRAHNDLEPVRPLVRLVPEGAWREILPQSSLRCTAEFARGIEWHLRHRIHEQERFGDDTVLDPVFWVWSSIKTSGWGVEQVKIASPQAHGAWTWEPVIHGPADLKRLRHPELVLEPYQMIIQLDAWSLRERDDWGRTDVLRRRGQEPERWHWVYTGTVFRLDHRGQSAGGRPVITQRGYVLTRQGLDALRGQMHGEALRRGLGQAASVLVIGDGAVWIWRLADDRWPQAKQRLDFYHAVQHLVAVGRALFGEDREKFKAWIKPLVRQLKNESAVKVIRQLDEALAGLPIGPDAETVAKEIAYLKEHQDRMDYRAGRRAGEPIGSGAVEATCRQAQCRFKRPGQFWTQAGDEALLCLETFWRNERWAQLFPHTAFDPARN